MEVRGQAAGKAIAALVLGIVSIAMSMLIAIVGLAAGIAIALFNYGLTFYLIASGRYGH